MDRVWQGYLASVRTRARLSAKCMSGSHGVSGSNLLGSTGRQRQEPQAVLGVPACLCGIRRWVMASLRGGHPLRRTTGGCAD